MPCFPKTGKEVLIKLIQHGYRTQFCDSMVMPKEALQRSAIKVKDALSATDMLGNQNVWIAKVDQSGGNGWHGAGGHLPERDCPMAEAARRYSHQPHHSPRSRPHLSARSGVPTRCPLRLHALRQVPQRSAPRRRARCPEGG